MIIACVLLAILPSIPGCMQAAYGFPLTIASTPSLMVGSASSNLPVWMAFALLVNALIVYAIYRWLKRYFSQQSNQEEVRHGLDVVIVYILYGLMTVSIFGFSGESNLQFALFFSGPFVLMGLVSMFLPFFTPLLTALTIIPPYHIGMKIKKPVLRYLALGGYIFAGYALFYVIAVALSSGIS